MGIWEAIGFTATSNNEARQAEKKRAVEKCKTSKSGVDENQTMFGPGGGGAEQRKEWLDKYGYPRLVGTGGIFYSDQLSSDAEPWDGVRRRRDPLSTVSPRKRSKALLDISQIST